MMSESVSQRLAKKHDQLKRNRDEMGKKLGQSTDESYLDICKLTADEINQKITSKQVTATEVLTAFQRRCQSIEKYNFLGEYILESNDWAKELDSGIHSNKQNSIYGVPISLKESIRIKGKDTTIGLVKHCGYPAEEDSVIFKVLRHLNAIPFITSSMAQSGLSINSSNPIFGKQENPRFSGYVAGGSSGGEGIALSLNASPLGIGTDIAGSIRFPAAFNEICSLKPTHRRISQRGNFCPDEVPCLHLNIILGPMGRSVKDLKNFMDSVLCPMHFELDPLVVPLPFNNTIYTGEDKPTLKIGYYDCFEDDNLVKAVPSIKRGIQKTVEVLEKRGHKLIPFKVPRPFDAFSLALKALLHDGGSSFVKLMSNEPLDDSLKTSLRIVSLPRMIKRTASFAPKMYYGHHIAPGIDASAGLNSSDEAAKLLRLIAAYICEFLDSMKELDAIICPLYPVPIPRIETIDVYNNVASCYSILYNLLDFPAGVLCVDRVNKDDIRTAEILKVKFTNEKNIVDALFHSNQNETGLPLTVQVVSKPFKEEMVLRVMKIIEDEVNFERKLPI